MNATSVLRAVRSLVACFAAAALHAGPRSSDSYAIRTDSADSGGTRTSSAAYTHDGTLGGLTGVSSVAAPAQVAKAGYIGQLYDVTSLQITATPATIDEAGTRQLSAGLLLDDATTLAVYAGDVVWNVTEGPISSINSTGLATARVVYQNTPATAQALYQGASGTLDLTVLDTLSDNFGIYASDGIDDAWQATFFGVNNPDAGATKDPDGDSQNNFFEFIAGLNPTDPSSVFKVTFSIPPGQPNHRRVVFGPRLDDRAYNVLITNDFINWSYLTSPTVSDNGTQRTVTDVNASGSRQFYRVVITRP
jgi:hypothetical protein